MKIRYLLSATIAWVACASLVNAEVIAPGLKGPKLRAEIRRRFSEHRALSYRDARRAMFSRIDNKDGHVRLVYTGHQFATRSIPNHQVVNTEHTWPQSKFRGALNRHVIKSDLHHLFPTFSRVNSARENWPFGEILDSETKAWWKGQSPQANIPETDIDAYSESAVGVFEPREDHKGNVARAMFYVFTIYETHGLELTWFRPQMATLLDWHIKDPVDARERQRNTAIKNVQGNENPFVLDDTLARRIFESAGGSATESSASLESHEDRQDSVRIACWNLAANAYFGRERHPHRINSRLREMHPRVAAAIAKIDAAVVGLVEVESETALDDLAQVLVDEHDQSYQQVFAPTGEHLNIGVLAREDVELGLPRLVAETTLGSSRLRASLRVPVKIDDFDFELVVVHLKSGGRGSDAIRIRREFLRPPEVRERQAERLAEYLSNIREAGEQDLLVIGDYNMFPSRDRTAFQHLADGAGLRFITNEELCEHPRFTNCVATHKAGNMLDGFGISRDNTREYRSNSVRVLQPHDLFLENGRFSEYRRDDRFWRGVSDHLPVVAEFLTVDLD